MGFYEKTYTEILTLPNLCKNSSYGLQAHSDTTFELD